MPQRILLMPMSLCHIKASHTKGVTLPFLSKRPQKPQTRTRTSSSPNPDLESLNIHNWQKKFKKSTSGSLGFRFVNRRRFAFRRFEISTVGMWPDFVCHKAHFGSKSPENKKMRREGKKWQSRESILPFLVPESGRFAGRVSPLLPE